MTSERREAPSFRFGHVPNKTPPGPLRQARSRTIVPRWICRRDTTGSNGAARGNIYRMRGDETHGPYRPREAVLILLGYRSLSFSIARVG